ncbi:hypothetical protein PENSPDRAFT_685099 [Peniophora sp. CONT]|nr:hypothetical protein PENSPDRAFT_685099 [Peniophora sp. CONT]
MSAAPARVERESARDRAIATANARVERDAARTRGDIEASERAEAAALRRTELETRERAEAAARRRTEIAARKRAETAARRRAELEAQERAEAAALRRAELEARERAEAAARARAELEARERAEAAARAQAELEARLRAEAAGRELQRQARLQAEREARERAEAAARERQRVLEEQERARLADQARLDAAKTTQSVVLGSIVTFGAGLEVHAFTTGFETRIVRIRGIPVNALAREIYALFTQQGIDKARLYLMLNKPLHDGTREVKMAMDAEAGHALSAGLDDLEFRDRRLSFEVGTYNVPGAMGISSVKDVEVLTVSWQAATARYVATYNSLSDARRKIQELNGSTHLGRRIRAETNTAPPGRLIYVDPNSIKIDNLPASATHDQVSALAGPEVVTLRALPMRGAPATAAPLEVVRTSALASGCSQSDIVSLELLEGTSDAINGIVKVRARFRTWDQAKVAHDYLNGRKLFGNVACRVILPNPLSYIITIPVQQFEAQRTQWAALRESVQVVGKDRGSLTQLDVPNKPIVRFRVSGSDKKAVGALKVQVEGLAAGEKVDGWHVRLSQHSNGAFVARVLADSGALMRADWRQRQLKIYGSPPAVARAREMIGEELVRLAGLELTTNIPPPSIRHFLAQGLPELRELLGEDNVRFNPATRILVTSGGDNTHHIVSRILEQASRSRTVLPAANEDTCPICFDNVSAPIRLGCGHAYCSTCLRHFVTSAADSDKFPLVCMGNEAHCNVPISIPSIERFLSQPLFTRLLEVTFRAYISQRPLELKYCRTPDCEQIYRVTPQDGPRPVPAQCPACLSVVCPGCHEDGHEGLTCQEQRVRSSPAEQERLIDEYIAHQGGRVKRCPQCRVLMEKIDGCNHMTCKHVFSLLHIRHSVSDPCILDVARMSVGAASASSPVILSTNTWEPHMVAIMRKIMQSMIPSIMPSRHAFCRKQRMHVALLTRAVELLKRIVLQKCVAPMLYLSV